MGRNKGADSGAACLAALLTEVGEAQKARQTLTSPQLIDALRRRGFTQEAIGRALVRAEEIGTIRFDPAGKFEGFRRQVRRHLGAVPPG